MDEHDITGWNKPQVPMSAFLPKPVGTPGTLDGPPPETPDMFTEADLHYDHPLDRRAEYDALNVIDLAAEWDGSHEPEMLVPGLVVAGAAHTLYGPKEQGKTWLVLAGIVKPLLAAGQPVIYIDKEMSRGPVIERLVALGVTPEQVAANLVYLELPTLNKTTLAKWDALLTDVKPALVFADASAGVLASAGLDENRTPDVLGWDADFFEPARRARAATLMLDHVGLKDGGRARGASGKGAAAKVELEMRTLEPFDRDTVGSVKVTRRKNSLAAPIPVTQVFRIGGSPFTFEHDAAADMFHPSDVSSGVDADEGLRARVESAVIEAGQDGLSTRELVAKAGGRTADVTTVAKQLALDPASPVQKRTGPHNANIYYIAPRTTELVVE